MERAYLANLQYILDEGYEVKDRTGTGTIVAPRPLQMHFENVGEEFPLFTTKYVSFNMLACEMLWFIDGSTNTDRLREIGSLAMADMWDNWAEDGELGPVYGYQWRHWGVDQLQTAIHQIRQFPESRRIIVSAWNPEQIDDMALPPCHMTFQFTCEPFEDTHRLHLHLLQRSADMFLGVPFNVAQYALLLELVSNVTDTIVGNLTWTGVNCHIYLDHVYAVLKQLKREPRDFPYITTTKLDDIDYYSINDIELHDYDPHPPIYAPVSL